MTGSVASQIGTAPRSPAQLSIIRSRNGSESDLGRDERRDRAGDEDQHQRQRRCPPSATSTSRLGKTSSPSMKNSEIWATQLSPWWKAVTVRRAGTMPVPSASPVR